MAVSMRRSGGFTLVELLVVVVIIGMLVGLMMPALLNARRTARQTTCINNLKELSKAAHLFHDSKKRLPGSILAGQTGKPNWTWVIELLDPLGRTDLWEEWRKGQSPQPLINTLVCTEDTDATAAAAAVSSQAALSYVPNNYYFRPRQYQSGLPTATTKTVSLTDVKSPSITILFAERTNSITSPSSFGNPSPWAPFSGTDDSRVTFPGRSNAWRPPTTGVVPETPLENMTNSGISSGHPGIVIVALADDSVVPLSTRTDMSIYIKAQVGIPTP